MQTITLCLLLALLFASAHASDRELWYKNAQGFSEESRNFISKFNETASQRQCVEMLSERVSLAEKNILEEFGKCDRMYKKAFRQLRCYFIKEEVFHRKVESAKSEMVSCSITDCSSLLDYIGGTLNAYPDSSEKMEWAVARALADCAHMKEAVKLLNHSPKFVIKNSTGLPDSVISCVNVELAQIQMTRLVPLAHLRECKFHMESSLAEVFCRKKFISKMDFENEWKSMAICTNYSIQRYQTYSDVLQSNIKNCYEGNFAENELPGRNQESVFE